MATITAYLGLGSSLGDRATNLRDALIRLETAGAETTVCVISPIYESPHLGLLPGDELKFPPHLNLVARIRTSLSPESLLAHIQAVEELGGRRRSERWGPRTIDIDILLYGDTKMHTPELTIPHPSIADRAFVAVPLADIAPGLRLPDGRTAAELRASEPIRFQRIERAEDELPV